MTINKYQYYDTMSSISLNSDNALIRILENNYEMIINDLLKLRDEYSKDNMKQVEELTEDLQIELTDFNATLTVFVNRYNDDESSNV